jgi:hypothetical protein
MPDRQSNSRDAEFVRGIQDHMPGTPVEYIVPGTDLGGNEMHLADLTLEGLTLKVVEYARGFPHLKAVTYRAVLYHSGKYHGFIGVRT